LGKAASGSLTPTSPLLFLTFRPPPGFGMGDPDVSDDDVREQAAGDFVE
jgi:hypothetical protein